MNWINAENIFYFNVCLDKNRAPGSAEAFKAVGNAVAILTDAEKRKSYDLYGSEERQHINRTGTFRTFDGGYGYSRGFEADVTAEELFNMFFGGGSFQAHNVYSSRSRRFHRQAEQEEREVRQKTDLQKFKKLKLLNIYHFSLDIQLCLILYQFYC